MQNHQQLDKYNCVGCGVIIEISGNQLCDGCSTCVSEEYDIEVKQLVDELSENENEDTFAFDDDEFGLNEPLSTYTYTNNVNNSQHQISSSTNHFQIVHNVFSNTTPNSQNLTIVNNANSTNNTKPFQSSITSFFTNITKKSQNTLDTWLGIQKPLSSPLSLSPSHPLSGTKRSPKSPKTSTNKKQNNKKYTKEGENDENSENGAKRQKTEEITQRKPPFYKRVENSNFFVDSFRFDCRIGCEQPKYFLSHFHSDHYGGITSKWNRGPIICSEVTGNLLRSRLRVHPDFIRPVALYSPFYLDNTKITLLCANHCPGASMFLFEFPNGRRALHVGDCRYCADMKNYKELQSVKIDLLYLDTTYCNPAYTFPTQTTIINHIAEIVANNLNHNTLFIVGTYTIGKEKIIVELANVFGFKVYAQPWKLSVLKQLQLPADFISSLTSKPEEAQLHVVPIWQLSKLHQNLSNKYSNIIAFKPTGWTHQSGGGLSTCSKKGNISIYGVPYSEHSSFTELREFVDYLKPVKIIPTVNNSNGNKVKEMIALLTS